MSLPYSQVVPITGKVQSPAFTVEKKHLILAMNNPLIPTSESYLTFSGSSALTDFKAYFGNETPEGTELQKYFSFLSKSGESVQKAIVFRWYQANTAPFYKGSSQLATLAELQAVTSGSFQITMSSNSFEVVLNLASATSYSDVATAMQSAIRNHNEGGEAFTGAVVTYSSITQGFIITSGVNGKEATIAAITAGTTGTDLSMMLGLANAQLSQGVDAESYADFCDRVYHANSSGFAITTLLPLTIEEIQPAVQWLQTILDGQTYNTRYKLIFNFFDKTTALTVSSTLNALSYTGYVLTYDPHQEYVNILDAAIGAAVNFNNPNGAINFNFQPAVGYTTITNLGSVVDYQKGLTNSSLYNELTNAEISFVYSLGFGEQEQIYYGAGLEAGDFHTEDAQLNEAALEQDEQVAIINTLDGLEKIQKQGSMSDNIIDNSLQPVFNRYVNNGVIAQGGTLSDSDKIKVIAATNNPEVIDTLESLGYYYMVYPRTDEDIQQNQVRVLSIYLASGVVNKVRIVNNIYGV